MKSVCLSQIPRVGTSAITVGLPSFSNPSFGEPSRSFDLWFKTSGSDFTNLSEHPERF